MVRKRVYTPRYDAWREKVPNAEIMTPEAFRERKEAQRFFVLGVMGYAGSWRRSGKRGQALEDYRALLEQDLVRPSALEV